MIPFCFLLRSRTVTIVFGAILLGASWAAVIAHRESDGRTMAETSPEPSAQTQNYAHQPDVRPGSI